MLNANCNKRTNGPVNAHMTIGQVNPQQLKRFDSNQRSNLIYVKVNVINMYG